MEMADKDVSFYLTHGIELVQCISLQQLFTKWHIWAITDQITIHHISGSFSMRLTQNVFINNTGEEKSNHQTKSNRFSVFLTSSEC